MKTLTLTAVAAVSVLALGGCDALQEVQDTANQAQAAAEEVSTRTAQIQQAVDNPLSAIQAVTGATFSKTSTDQPGVYVLTDLQTGCQFLGTYAADGTTVASIAPRVEAVAGGGTRQRCVAIPGVARPDAVEAESEAGAEG